MHTVQQYTIFRLLIHNEVWVYAYWYLISYTFQDKWLSLLNFQFTSYRKGKKPTIRHKCKTRHLLHSLSYLNRLSAYFIKDCKGLLYKIMLDQAPKANQYFSCQSNRNIWSKKMKMWNKFYGFLEGVAEMKGYLFQDCQEMPCVVVVEHPLLVQGLYAFHPKVFPSPISLTAAWDHLDLLSLTTHTQVVPS